MAQHAGKAKSEGAAVLIMGDTNALPGFPSVAVLRESGFAIADPKGASFHFNCGLHLYKAIDRMACGGGAEVIGGPWVLRGKRLGEWPSDHYPVVADLSVN